MQIFYVAEATLSSLRAHRTFKTVVKCKSFRLPIVGRPKLWWNANLLDCRATLHAKSDRRTPKLWWNANLLDCRATLHAKSDRRTPETVVKCRFSGSSRNPLVTSCSSGVQNLWWNANFWVDGQPFLALRAGRTSETVVKRWFLYAARYRGFPALVSYMLLHAAVVKRTFWSFGWHAADRWRDFDAWSDRSRGSTSLSSTLDWDLAKPEGPESWRREFRDFCLSILPRKWIGSSLGFAGNVFFLPFGFPITSQNAKKIARVSLGPKKYEKSCFGTP